MCDRLFVYFKMTFVGKATITNFAKMRSTLGFVLFETFLVHFKVVTTELTKVGLIAADILMVEQRTEMDVLFVAEFACVASGVSVLRRRCRCNW